jgi:hypothetical protein
VNDLLIETLKDSDDAHSRVNQKGLGLHELELHLRRDETELGNEIFYYYLDNQVFDNSVSRKSCRSVLA